ncbi:hypothetical protein V8G54_012391, partial [Vigna mungo]
QSSPTLRPAAPLNLLSQPTPIPNPGNCSGPNPRRGPNPDNPRLREVARTLRAETKAKRMSVIAKTRDVAALLKEGRDEEATREIEVLSRLVFDVRRAAQEAKEAQEHAPA